MWDVMWSFCDHYGALREEHEGYVPFLKVMHEHAEQQQGPRGRGKKPPLSESLSNVYLSVGSAGMIKGPSEFLLCERAFLQRHQISQCRDKRRAPPA